MKHIKKTFTISILSFLSLLFFSYASASAIPCPSPDIGKNCGAVNTYNVYAECSLSGPDIYGGNRILGGQKCVIGGGSDFAGYRMDGTSEPNSSTPTISLGDGVAPGWTYNKTGTLFANGIPTGEWTISGLPYYIYRFFGGTVTSRLPSADDESMLQVGSSYSYWTGCNSNGFRSVVDASCPAQTFMGSNSTTANPGDPIVFSVQNDLRPNNGSGIWASGQVDVTLQEVTECYTSAYKIAQGGYNDTQTFHPTAPGVCTPETSPCAINTFSCSSIRTLGWSTSGCSSVGVTGPANYSGATGSVTNATSGTYTLTADSQTSTAICPAPPPALDAKWAENNNDDGDNNPATLTKTLTPGQNSMTLDLNFWNSGESGSTLKVTGCIPNVVSGNASATIPIPCTGTFIAD